MIFGKDEMEQDKMLYKTDEEPYLVMPANSIHVFVLFQFIIAQVICII